MLATGREMLDEAEKRLLGLGFPQSMTWAFHGSGEPWICLPILGDCYPIEADELKQLAQQCGREYDVLIYLVLRFYSPNGTEDAFLYVDRDIGRWEEARECLAAGMPKAIVYKYSSGEDEIRTVGISRTEHGIIRVS